jgi:hypothetical protein
MQYKGATQQLIPRIASAGNKKILSREGGKAASFLPVFLPSRQLNGLTA